MMSGKRDFPRRVAHSEEAGCPPDPRWPVPADGSKGSVVELLRAGISRCHRGHITLSYSSPSPTRSASSRLTVIGNWNLTVALINPVIRIA